MRYKMTSPGPWIVCNNWGAIFLTYHPQIKEQMMIAKKPINLNRIRKVPKQFSWLDQRLVRDRHIDRLSLPAAALYLFLVTVCDAKGLSYWSDAAVMQRLNIDQQTLADARKKLLEAQLIAWKKPLYQVLSLDPDQSQPRREMARPLSLGGVFKKAMGETR